ncbi:MAG: biotin-dependent carboxyltransferase family protein [Nocardioidaceae bacterium]
MTLTVLATGALSTIQDQGRVGWAAVGVSRSGAADRGALRLANRLVGNPPDAAGLEVTMGGLALRAEAPVVLALTGASGPATVDGRGVVQGAAVRLATGQSLTIGAPVVGLRTYVGVRGGLAVPAVLGSRSTDTLAGIGPEPLREGDVLPVGSPGGPPSDAEAPDVIDPRGPLVRVVLGPRDDRFPAASVDGLLRQPWRVGVRSDRIGVRLEAIGSTRIRAKDAGTGDGDGDGDEPPSEGVVRGAVQVPPSGQPTVFGPDHPVTGGYPVIAVVIDADADLLGQVRPGDLVRFARVSLRPVSFGASR